MAITATALKRVFKYQALELADPGAHMTPDQVRQAYAGHYPELTNAVIEGPVTRNGTSTFTFTRAVGSKGLSHHDALRALVAGSLQPTGKGPLSGTTPQQREEAARCSKTAAATIQQRQPSLPLPVQPGAFSLYG